MEAERITAFLHSLEPEENPFLKQLRSEAEEEGIPIIRRETESFLRAVSAMKKPHFVLELGTAIGYSALVFLETADAVVTVENYEKRFVRAEENFRKAGVSEKVTLLKADAGEALKQMIRGGRQFDLVFLDAAKGQYSLWLEDIKKCLSPGGVLLADNVLQDLTVLESRFTVDRRDRTTHERMREFLYRIKHDPELTSCVIPLGDGVSVSVKH